ncbi:hypothetical protein D0859_05175 [Hortaea werneckii]|uniref:Zn(2)-C6 fungal-type domain-containing protein n=1 Tax=Hortaea werneckii TaxID=91943 RepID=A0A3M7IZ30_HORWE|nr:hypothetical protein D0859_05175 [Hortaea werneckii]
MAPDGKRDDSSDAEANDDKGPESSVPLEAIKRLSRKRTKTGCLTCRKRRIKCGEERPVCKNCIKSKRHCDGYNQRVVFKPPTFDYRPTPHGGAHITFQAGPVPGPAAPHETELLPPGTDLGSHLRSRPVEHFAGGFHATSLPYFEQNHHPQVPFHPSQTSFATNGGPRPAFPGHPGYGSHNAGQHEWSPFLVQQHASNLHNGPGIPQEHPTSTFALPQRHNLNQQHTLQQQPAIPELPRANSRQDNSQNSFADSCNSYISPSNTNAAPHSFAARQDEQMPPWSSRGYVPRPELVRPIDSQEIFPAAPYQWPQSQTTAVPAPQAPQHSSPEYHDYQSNIPISDEPTHILSQAAVETLDDDYYDVQSDEEMGPDTAALMRPGDNEHQALSGILNSNHINIPELQMRRYDTFIYAGMLDHYRVEEHANPLRNPATARVFAHFIAVTGPSLSIFERHPRNTSVLFTEGHVPTSQQGLWTYTMPMAALRNQGLLHAMLALASLHIARLTGASVTPSMQHYAWALKRIHKCVGHPKMRLKMTTIAASMLLGFYEVMTADHMKWNAHLAGSKQLITETDFVTMTQQFRRMKLERASRVSLGGRTSSMPSLNPQDDILDQIPDVDERVVSQMVGREVRYGDHGQIMSPTERIPPQLDLTKFEILKDLYWWYCKQDAYQSIISGNSLLMNYGRWANCPPRAPLGKPDAIYGTFDHLILLLGRIADFAARDRPRKLKQIEVNGGSWRPAPGMDIPRPPQPAAPPTPHSTHANLPPQAQAGFPPQSTPTMPSFYGMAPPPRQNVQMPSSYAPLNDIHTPQRSPPNDSMDLNEATQAALREYGEIRAALHTFAASLGEAYQPLPPEYQPVIDSPFGSALVYRTFDIGTLWGVYNMCMIIAIRSHPHMPPAAHMAAGVAAQQTAPYAQEIGRIAAGIVPGPPDQPLNPSLGAALCESCMPSFFAAIQYRDARQRHATITRIHSIAQRTGWGSAEVIANGCETSWVKAAAAGRGPPYTRIARNRFSDDPRVNGSWERLDPNAIPSLEDDTDRRLIRTQPPARLNWAIGIMGTEDDVVMAD